MITITTKNGTEIYYRDWAAGQPVVFSPGWPLSGDCMKARCSSWRNIDTNALDFLGDKGD